MIRYPACKPEHVFRARPGDQMNERMNDNMLEIPGRRSRSAIGRRHCSRARGRGVVWWGNQYVERLYGCVCGGEGAFL